MSGRGKNPASWGNSATGSKHHRWTPGGSVASNGYVKIRVGKEHPLADPNGYAYEHQVVWASAGLPSPEAGEVIHHKNEDKTDNRIGNLELRNRCDHSVSHQPGALSDADIARLRDDYHGGDHTGILAKRYRISAQYAWKIVRGLTRRDAGGPIVDGPLRGKKAAGRLLDGVEHNGLPEVRT